MRLRTFTAPNMPAAMRMVRDALGEDAVILSSATDKARGQVTVTAAIDAEERPDERLFVPGFEKAIPKAETPAPEPQLGVQSKAWMLELSELLKFHNVPEFLTARLLDGARLIDMEALLTLQRIASQQSRGTLEVRALRKVLEHCFRFEPLDATHQTLRIMLVGPPGIGKTLCIAKLAAQLAMEKKPVAVVTCDTKRAGGVEQLQAFTDILKIPLKVAESKQELMQWLNFCRENEHILVDTAGCNVYEREDMREIADLADVSAVEPVLTLPAGLDALEAAEIAEAFTMPGIRRLLITRIDATRRFGSVLAAADARKLALCNASDTARIVGELKPFDSGLLAAMLLKRHGR